MSITPYCECGQKLILDESGSCQSCGRVQNNGPALVNNCEWDTTHGLIGTRQDWGAGPGGASDSVRDTQNKGKEEIRKIAAQLGLQTMVDSASRLFNLAAKEKFTQGRRRRLVCACCLYLCCRLEENPKPILLIDFAEAIQANMFSLGNCYLRLKDKLKFCNRNPGFRDPSIFINKFAGKLGLSTEEFPAVVRTAVSLVKRMRRDWLTLGRRPSGICAAALVLSCRIHKVSKTQREILDAVRVCDETLVKRLREFENTKAAHLSIDEFNSLAHETDNFDMTDRGEIRVHDNLESADPPSFAKETETEAETAIQHKEEFEKLYEALRHEFEEIDKRAAAAPLRTAPLPTAALPTAALPTVLLPAAGAASDCASDDASAVSAVVVATQWVAPDPNSSSAGDSQLMPPPPTRQASNTDTGNDADGGHADGGGGGGHADGGHADGGGGGDDDDDDDDDDESDLGDADEDDDEINGYLLDESRARTKERHWNHANKPWLKKQAVRAQQIANGTYKPRRKRRRKTDDAQPLNADGSKRTSLQAATESVKKAKLSSKIDYGVLAACLGGGEEGSDGEGMAGDADW